MKTSLSKSEQLGALSDSVFKYMQIHSTSVEMNTQYILDAVTLSSDPNKMVLVADSKKASGRHIDYRKYVNGHGLDEAEDPKYSEEIGLHFKFVERTSLIDNISLISKRYVSDAYLEAVPVFSND